MDHNFLIFASEKYTFVENFISWVKVLLRNQESCGFNRGASTKYFLLGRGTHQDNPVTIFLFILALEFLFHLIKPRPEIKRLEIFDRCYLYSIYTDDITFSLHDTISLRHMIDTSYFFFLKT